MGADFSLLPRPPSPPKQHSSTNETSNNSLRSSTNSSSSTPKRQRLSLFHLHLRANTLANRSPTPVATHIALSRLAERLASLSLTPRRKLIQQLRIPSHILKLVAKYHPTRAFGRNVANQQSQQQQQVQKKKKKIKFVSFNDRPELIQI